MTALPICCVTGRIAGDPFACGDCDPCGAADTVPEVVKNLIKERDGWAEKYAGAMMWSWTSCAPLRTPTASIFPLVPEEQTMIAPKDASAWWYIRAIISAELLALASKIAPAGYIPGLLVEIWKSGRASEQKEPE